MATPLEKMSSLELWEKGLEILSRELGPVGFVRFLQLLENGYGDYTEERRRTQSTMGVRELATQIEQFLGR